MHNELIKSGQTIEIIVSEQQANQRVDQFLHEQFPLYSRSFFHRAIEDEYVTINGKLLKKSGHKTKTADLIAVTFPHKRKITAQMVKEEAPDVQTIASEPHFLIINKPAGLLVHPTTSTSKAITLMDWLIHSIEGIDQVGYVDRPGIIHRLDKDTSGIMIIPRTNYGFGQLGELFRDRSIEKIYYAIVKGHPPKEGIIDLSIGRHPVERTRMTTFKEGQTHPTNSKIRHALTHYQVVQYFEDAALVRVELKTGRTHQIRVHFAAIGHPIIGDIMYGEPSTLINRQALHAKELSFTFDGKAYHFEAPLPEDMQALLAHLKPIEEAY